MQTMKRINTEHQYQHALTQTHTTTNTIHTTIIIIILVSMVEDVQNVHKCVSVCVQSVVTYGDTHTRIRAQWIFRSK